MGGREDNRRLLGGHWWLKDGSESTLMMATWSHNDTDMTDLSMTNKLAVGVQSDKKHYFQGVSGVCHCVFLVRICPRDPSRRRKKIYLVPNTFAYRR